MEQGKLTFKPINLELNAEEAILFREDYFVCSFGDSSLFDPSQYLEWIRTKLSKDPGAAVHVWMGNELVGQLELGRFSQEPSAGYVNLYYLVPDMRGKGLSIELDRYAMNHLKKNGHDRAYTSVSQKNMRALRYYIRMGWLNRGPHPEVREVNLLEKRIP